MNRFDDDASRTLGAAMLTKTLLAPPPSVGVRLADMHAIKNDLCVVQSVLALLEREVTEQGKERLARGRASLARVIDAVVGAAGCVGVRAEAERRPARHLLESVCQQVRDRADELEVGLVLVGTDDEPGAPVDACLHEVIVNLVCNAIEASPRLAEVRLELGRTEDGDLLFRVVDRGHGILADVLAGLGQKRSTTKSNGSGLGLLISCETVHALGGALRFETAAGVGTTATVFVPSATPETFDAELATFRA